MKNKPISSVSLFVAVLFFLSSCSQKNVEQSGSTSKIRVLTYSSFLGEKSLGSWLKSEFEKANPGVDIVFIEARDESGLVGELRRPRQKKDSIDVVFGLDDAALKRAGADRFSVLQKMSSSPMTILVNEDRAPKSLVKHGYRFSTWKELVASGLLKGSVLVQDPRFSSPGFSWLLQSHSVKDVDAKQMHSLVRRVFPSWSSSFGALESSEGFAIWTYSSSLSYYRCKEPKKNFAPLVVDEGYVSSTETAGILNDSPNAVLAKALMTYFLGEAFQKKMVELNWVYPASDVAVPECYVPRSKFGVLSPEPNPSRQQINEWIDEWQLF